MLDSFSAARSVLANVPTLVHSDQTPRIFFSLEALGSHVGAVFQQEAAGSSVESRYYAFDRELLAAYSSLRHFQFLLEGKEFV